MTSPLVVLLAAVRHLRCWCRHWHRPLAIARLAQNPRLCEAHATPMQATLWSQLRLPSSAFHCFPRHQRAAGSAAGEASESVSRKRKMIAGKTQNTSYSRKIITAYKQA